MNPREADRRLEMIRSLMDRSTRWAGLPASACLIAAACAGAGSAWCAWKGLTFEQEEILPVWFATAGVSFVQFAVFTVAGARKRGEPPMSRLTWAALISMIPGLFSGAVLTFVVSPLQRPGVWMLCYGTAVYSLGYFAGERARGTGVLFLIAGAASLLALPDRGVLMMAVSFGGLHALLGILLLCQPRENHEAVLFDDREDR
jgi:hypothetical protein